MDQSTDNYVRLRGLPFSAGEKEVREFLEGLNVVEVMFINNHEGRPAGECYVEFGSKEDAEKAMEKHQQNMGKRYIEVFTVSEVDLKKIMRRQQQKQRINYGECHALRIRGLPFSCKKDDISNFFTGYQNSIAEIILGRERGGFGRPTGEAFVRFTTKDALDGAMQFDGKHMGSRYLELFRSDAEAFQLYKQRMKPDAMPPPSLRDFEQGYGPDRYDMGYDRFENRRSRPPSLFDNLAPSNDDWMRNDMYPPSRDSYPPSRDLYAPQRMPTRLADIPSLVDYGYESSYGRGYGSGRRGDDSYLDSGRSYDSMLGSRAYPTESSYRDSVRYSPYDYPPRRSQVSNSYSGGYDDVHGSDEFVTPTKVHMRGLPFRVTVKEIERFFEPLQPIEIKLGSFKDGRSAGDAIVEFSTMAEARVAVEKDKQMIGNRYIELFPSSSMKIVPGTIYKTVGGRPMQKIAPAPLSGYQWSSY